MATLPSDQVTRLEPLLPRKKSWFEANVKQRISFLSFPSASFLLDDDSTDDADDTAPRARWWKIVPIESMKFAGVVLVVPTLTNIKTKFFNGDTKKAAFVQSVVDSTRAVFMICVTVQLGQLSDAFGRKPLIVLSIFCTAVPLMCLTYFNNLWYYLVTFALAGMLGGQLSPASQAYVADCCPQEKRARILGLQGAIMSASFMVLPGLGSFLEYHYGQSSLYITALALQVTALGVACWLPESLPESKRQPFVAKDSFSTIVSNLRGLFSRRGSFLWDLAVLRFLKGVAMGVPTSFAMTSLLDFSDADFALLLTVSMMTGVIVQSVLLKYMMQCGCSELTLMVFSLFVDTFFYFGNCLLGRFPFKMLAILLHVFDSLSLVFSPSLNALIMKGHDDVGFVIGAFSTVDQVTSLFSPWLMAGTYQLSVFAPFVIAGFLNLICAVLALRLRMQMAAEGDIAN